MTTPVRIQPATPSREAAFVDAWRPARVPTGAGLVLAALLLAGGCAKKSTASEAFIRTVTERQLDDGLILQEVDLDRDGKAEILNYYRERADAPRLLVRKEMDLNRDGTVDIVSYFDNGGRLEREEMDSDFDGIFDHVDHYQNNARVMSEYDTNNDGRPNVFKYYVRDENGVPRLDRKERDTDSDGKIDVWERFNAQGEVTRTGRDTDGDGKMDVREE